MIFLKYSKGDKLASRLRELARRIAPIIGFGIKVVERAGRSLGSQFPLTSLWDGAACGRQECITCTHGEEDIPPCTQKSVVYENVCGLCNIGAKEAKELKEVRSEVPTIYVGETSRSIKERSEEHWSSYKSGSEKSHMMKHQTMEHGGEPSQFVMRVVSFHRTALSRQIAEAVRIRRRGGGGSNLE